MTRNLYEWIQRLRVEEIKKEDDSVFVVIDDYEDQPFPQEFNSRDAAQMFIDNLSEENFY